MCSPSIDHALTPTFDRFGMKPYTIEAPPPPQPPVLGNLLLQAVSLPGSPALDLVCIALHCLASPRFALHRIALHCIHPPHCIAPRKRPTPIDHPSRTHCEAPPTAHLFCSPSLLPSPPPSSSSASFRRLLPDALDFHECRRGSIRSLERWLRVVSTGAQLSSGACIFYSGRKISVTVRLVWNVGRIPNLSSRTRCCSRPPGTRRWGASAPSGLAEWTDRARAVAADPEPSRAGPGWLV